MLLTTKQVLSSVWLVIALIIATLLAIALPHGVQAQTLAVNSVFVEGQASYYNLTFHGKKTANGERFDNTALTAASATLPFNTMVKVTNLENNKFVVVRINDRMPAQGKHMIDLSGAAAEKLDMLRAGSIRVQIAILDPSDFAIGQTPVGTAEMGPPQPKPQQKAVTHSPTIVSQVEAASSQVSPRLEVYTLQIGSFSTLARAQTLSSQYKEAWTARVEVNGEVTFRVYYSRFDAEKAARVAQNNLWTKGQDSFLRKVVS